MSVYGINVRWMLAGMVRRQVVCVVRKSDDTWKAVWNVAFATEISASPYFWYLWCGSVGTYDSDRGSSISGGSTGSEDCSFHEKTLGVGLTVRLRNRHISQCQRTLLLRLAQQSSAVLPFTEHAMCFSNTEISVLCLFPPMAWLFSQLGRSLFLELLLLGLTLPFWCQFWTSHKLETSCSFMVSVSCLCLWTTLARALLLQHPPALPGCSSAVSNWCPQHRPSIALISAAGMWGLFALTQELTGGVDTGIGMDVCLCACIFYSWLFLRDHYACFVPEVGRGSTIFCCCFQCEYWSFA